MISSHFSDEGPHQGEGYGYETGGDRKRRRFAPYESRMGDPDKRARVCLDNLNGVCRRGASCKFSHEEERQVCRDFLNNLCRRFKHPSERGPATHQDDRRDVCKDYLNFKCDRGRSCKFYHPPRDSRRPRNGGWSRYDTSSRRIDRERDVPGGADFVAVCRDFLSGNCYKDRCNFVHLGRDGRSLDRPRSPPPSYRDYPPWDRGFDRRERWGRGRDRAEVCLDYLNGKCNRGRDCKFSHPVDRGRPEVCREFLNGRCTRGSTCRYEHDEKRLEAERRSDVCREFLNGRCTRGAGCKYVHDEEVLAREREEGGQRCRLFQRGRCHKGDECRFAHVDEDGKIIKHATEKRGDSMSDQLLIKIEDTQPTQPTQEKSEAGGAV